MDLPATPILLSLLELVGALGFTVIALSLYNISRLLQSSRLGLQAAAFSLLALSQYLMALSTVVAEPALSTALYVASGSAAALGFYPLGVRGHDSGNEFIILIILYKIIISVPDAIAGIIGLKTGLNAKGASRILVPVIASTFLARSLIIASTILHPSPHIVYSSLTFVESIKAIVTITLLAVYLKGGGNA